MTSVSILVSTSATLAAQTLSFRCDYDSLAGRTITMRNDRSRATVIDGVTYQVGRVAPIRRSDYVIMSIYDLQETNPWQAPKMQGTCLPL